MLNQLYSNLRATPLKISLFFVKSISRNFREIDFTKKGLYYTFSNSISLWQRCNVATSIALMKKNRCLRQCWQAQNLERESRGIETLRGKRYYYTTRDDHFFHTDASTSYTYTCIVILVLVIPSLLEPSWLTISWLCSISTFSAQKHNLVVYAVLFLVHLFHCI